MWRNQIKLYKERHNFFSPFKEKYVEFKSEFENIL
jgi:hypothetical protein